MTKSGANLIKVVKTIGGARANQTLRKALLRELNVQNEHEIDGLVTKHLEQAKTSRKRAAANDRKRKYVHEFLADATALFLLASEPRFRASKLAETLYSQYQVKKHKDTTLLALILKAIGPYRHDARRTISRDAKVLEFLISRGVMPDDIPSHLQTRGQGIHTTSRFNPSAQTPRKDQLTFKPKPAEHLGNRTPGRSVLALLVETETGFEMTDCLTHPSIIRAANKFITDMLKPRLKPPAAF